MSEIEGEANDMYSCLQCVCCDAWPTLGKVERRCGSGLFVVWPDLFFFIIRSLFSYHIVLLVLILCTNFIKKYEEEEEEGE